MIGGEFSENSDQSFLLVCACGLFIQNTWEPCSLIVHYEQVKLCGEGGRGLPEADCPLQNGSPFMGAAYIPSPPPFSWPLICGKNSWYGEHQVGKLGITRYLPESGSPPIGFCISDEDIQGRRRQLDAEGDTSREA